MRAIFHIPLLLALGVALSLKADASLSTRTLPQTRYDNADRLLSTTTPGSRTTAQSYNARGLVGTITEPSTQGTALTYDARGRVATRADGVGTITYGYDNNSNVLTVLQSGVTQTRTYDALNRVTSYNDGRGHTLGYAYDNNGNLASLTYEAGKTVTYTYDSRNRLTGITDWTGRTTALAYDGAGRLLTLTRPNGTVRANTWDAASAVVHRKGNQHPALVVRPTQRYSGGEAWDAEVGVAGNRLRLHQNLSPAKQERSVSEREQAFEASRCARGAAMVLRAIERRVAARRDDAGNGQRDSDAPAGAWQ